GLGRVMLSQLTNVREAIFLVCVDRAINILFFFFSSRRRHTRLVSDWSSDVCSSDLRLKPYTATYVNTLGLAQYRAGRFQQAVDRSEERRVGKEWRCRWSACY